MLAACCRLSNGPYCVFDMIICFICSIHVSRRSGNEVELQQGSMWPCPLSRLDFGSTNLTASASNPGILLWLSCQKKLWNKAAGSRNSTFTAGFRFQVIFGTVPFLCHCAADLGLYRYCQQVLKG